jgi:hypothetical protein
MPRLGMPKLKQTSIAWLNSKNLAGHYGPPLESSHGLPLPGCKSPRQGLYMQSVFGMVLIREAPAPRLCLRDHYSLCRGWRP